MALLVGRDYTISATPTTSAAIDAPVLASLTGTREAWAGVQNNGLNITSPGSTLTYTQARIELFERTQTQRDVYRAFVNSTGLTAGDFVEITTQSVGQHTGVPIIPRTNWVTTPTLAADPSQTSVHRVVSSSYITSNERAGAYNATSPDESPANRVSVYEDGERPNVGPFFRVALSPAVVYTLPTAQGTYRAGSATVTNKFVGVGGLKMSVRKITMPGRTDSDGYVQPMIPPSVGTFPSPEEVFSASGLARILGVRGLPSPSLQVRNELRSPDVYGVGGVSVEVRAVVRGIDMLALAALQAQWTMDGADDWLLYDVWQMGSEGGPLADEFINEPTPDTYIVAMRRAAS